MISSAPIKGRRVLRIGTRDSQLAIWQATTVQSLLKEAGYDSELVYIKSEGDVDTVTPLYALGVTGVFTKTLDIALLDKRIDIAVHSMKDVPVQMAQGIRQASVLKRGSHKDIFVPHPKLKDPQSVLGRGVLEVNHISLVTQGKKEWDNSYTTLEDTGEPAEATIATSSIRRIAQWRRRYPHHSIENLRGNVNTRLRKLSESNWAGAIFAAAGLERINVRPENAIDLDWMLPAPAQGAIMIVCREDDDRSFDSCQSFNHAETALCTKIERDFLSGLMGGCSTPISALAQVVNKEVVFKGNVAHPEIAWKIAQVDYTRRIEDAHELGFEAAWGLLSNGGSEIVEHLRKKGLNADEA